MAAVRGGKRRNRGGRRRHDGNMWVLKFGGKSLDFTSGMWQFLLFTLHAESPLKFG